MSANSNRKAVILIGDGMGDRPCPELGGKTPLEAAKTPNLDAMASKGINGLMDLIAPGVRVGSDTGHLAVLGFDPYVVYTGRGPFEAAGIGLSVKPGDVAFRCNFSTVEADMMITDRRAGRIEEGTDQLAAQVNGVMIEDAKILFKESVAHRCALVLRGPGLNALVTDSDPHVTGEKVLEVKAITAGDAAGEKTARILNAFIKLSYEKLDVHPVNVARKQQGLNPANIILPRGAGQAPNIPSFNEKNLLHGACVAETGLIKGIADFVGLDLLDAPGATGGLDSDVMSMGNTVLKALETHDFVLCNVKGPDVAAHDGNPVAKVAIIEKIDEMVGMLIAKMGDQTYLAVTADHTTSCSYGDHTGEPVPIVLYGPEVLTDDVQTFGERPAQKGGLCRFSGKHLVNMLTSLMNVQEKYGA